ncbi:replication endonuclease, partial [Bacillus sp. HC-Mk]
MPGCCCWRLPHLPYVSYEAVTHKREQRRKSLEFFRSHELVNEDGDTLDMEDEYGMLVKQLLEHEGLSFEDV